MPIKATFSSHSIQRDGLHIFSVTEDGVEIETLVSQVDATLFEWIGPDDGIDEEEEEFIGTESRLREIKQRELAKLEEWNALAEEATQ